MRTQPLRRGALGAALLAAALACIGLAPTAQAKLVGEFTKFQYCPWKEASTLKCIYALTKGGKVVLGSKDVTITSSVLLQGGFGTPDPTTKVSKFYGATNGVTLQKVPQNVPGGLAGVVPQKGSGWLVERLVKFFFENSLTGLSSTLELAKPATAIEISEFAMSRKEGVALKMPIKIHLENPFLGSKCYVGSESSPITWNLTSGKTSPPGPNTSIEGSFGKASFLEEGLILHLEENKLVDNSWSAPQATGCGGILGFLVNPVVNSQLGTVTAGHNTAILENSVDLASTAAIKFIDAENP
jgi:hypothetical protein